MTAWILHKTKRTKTCSTKILIVFIYILRVNVLQWEVTTLSMRPNGQSRCQINAIAPYRWCSTLVQIMALGCQARSHYLSQCLSRSLSPFDITTPQWVKCHQKCIIRRSLFQWWRHQMETFTYLAHLLHRPYQQLKPDVHRWTTRRASQQSKSRPIMLIEEVLTKFPRHGWYIYEQLSLWSSSDFIPNRI